MTISHPPEYAPTTGTHAIVIGGSMAGLLAARVLADHFDRVTIVDRDRFPETPAFRKGVPQSRHAHLLLVRGREILERLFPGLKAVLFAEGAPIVDITADFRLRTAVDWIPRFQSPIRTFSCSRDLLEWSVRRQFAADGNVSFLQEREAIDLVPNADKTRVVGVRVRARNRGEGEAADVEDLRADLVVDASGRSSRAVQWLKDLGYPAPAETIINSFLGYASRCYAQPRNLGTDWKALGIGPRPPANPRSGVLVPLEGQRWLVTLVGAGRDYPPTEEAGFLEFARSLASPMLYEAIKDAQPLSSIYGYQRTENRLLHFERMPRWPAGFVATGDAVCAFNPVYGQGMTTAALGAITLDRVLRVGNREGMSKRFQQQLAKSNQAAWLMATGEDFRYPTTEGGKRSRITRLTHWYMSRVIETVTANNDVCLAFIEAAHLLKPPASLFHPRIMMRVLQYQVARRRGDKVTR